MNIFGRSFNVSSRDGKLPNLKEREQLKYKEGVQIPADSCRSPVTDTEIAWLRGLLKVMLQHIKVGAPSFLPRPVTSF